MRFSTLPHWIVGEQRYYNQFETFGAMSRTSQPARFCLYDHVFDSVDWTQEPTESWNELLRLRCLQLRHKYKHLVLLYSGGRDSHCVLKSFAKYSIPIDELLLVNYVHNPVRTKEYRTWIMPLAQQYKVFNPQVKITTISVDIDDYKKFYVETWSERPTATLINGLFQPSDYTWLIDQKYKVSHSGTGIVNGLEKPELAIKDNKIYSITTDRAFMHYFYNQTLMEFFYITPDLPDLHVKQSWLVANHVSSHYPLADKDFLRKFQHSHGGYYDEFAFSAGRGPAVDKNSPSQNGLGKYAGNHPAFQVVKRIVQNEAPDVWNHYKENLDFFYDKSGPNVKMGQSRPDSFWMGNKPIEGNHYFMSHWPVKIKREKI